MLKRFSILMLTALTVLSLIACSEKNDTDDSEEVSNNASETVSETTSTTVPEDASEASKEESKEDLQKTEPKEYTVLTSGEKGNSEKVAVGDKITACPFDIAPALASKQAAIKYGKLYKGWVTVSGYVHFSKDGFFVLTDGTECEDKYIATIVVEDSDINSDNGWSIKDGDYITVIGRCKGAYYPSDGEYYIVVNEAFLTE